MFFSSDSVHIRKFERLGRSKVSFVDVIESLIERSPLHSERGALLLYYLRVLHVEYRLFLRQLN